MTYPLVEVGELIVRRNGSIDPSKFPDEEFELHSIPAFDAGQPEFLLGRQIGSSKQVVQPDDVMISKIVPHIRRSSVVNPASGRRQIASGEWIIFRSERVFPEYLRHVLISEEFHKKFMATVSGVGGSLLRARPAEVAKIKIPLPSLPEQRRIAVILDKAEALCSKRHDAIAKLDALPRAVFRNMFECGTASTNVFPIDQVVERIIDYRGKTPTKTSSGTPLITARLIKGMRVAPPSEFIASEDYSNWMTRGIPAPGSVLITTEAPMGEVALMPAYKAALAQRLLALEPKKTLINPTFMMWALSMPSIKAQLGRYATGSTVTGIRQKDFRKVLIPVPPIEAQGEFEAIAIALGEQRARCEAMKRDAEAMFLSLEQHAFEGGL